ncbi:MAG TPA: hypothetical protein VFB00_03905 [Terriglobales bacterium]|nr:hypothetical protein [Terriglobales bacterium]
MTRYVGVVLLLLVEMSPVSLARKEEPLDQLIARANAARPEQQPDLYMELADRLLKLAIEANKADQPEQFRSHLRDIVKYCDKAHSAAMHANKQLKRTEIRIRRVSTRLQDLKLDVDVDDQPQVQAAIDRLEGFRAELLHSMFGSKSND